MAAWYPPSGHGLTTSAEKLEGELVCTQHHLSLRIHQLLAAGSSFYCGSQPQRFLKKVAMPFYLKILTWFPLQNGPWMLFEWLSFSRPCSISVGKNTVTSVTLLLPTLVKTNYLCRSQQNNTFVASGPPKNHWLSSVPPGQALWWFQRHWPWDFHWLHNHWRCHGVIMLCRWILWLEEFCTTNLGWLRA